MLIGKPLLTLGALAYLAVAAPNGLDRLSKGSPKLARLVAKPFRAEASRSASYAALVDGNVEGAVANALEAVEADPIDPNSTAALGSAFSLAGNVAGADRAYRVAAMFGWRNEATQAYLYSVALDVGNYAVAADRADAIMRAHPRIAERAELFDSLVDVPQGQSALAEKLAQNPPWASNFFNFPNNDTAASIDDRLAVLAAIPLGKSQLECASIAPFAQRLIEVGRRVDGMRIWNGSCPRSKVSNPISDLHFLGLFADDADWNPFGWKRVPSGDVSVQRRGTEKEPLTRLTNRASTTRMLLMQSADFRPGRYRITVTAQGQEPQGVLSATLGCGRVPVFPARVEGDAVNGGQVLSVNSCERQQFGLWLKPNSQIEVRSISFTRVGA